MPREVLLDPQARAGPQAQVGEHAPAQRVDGLDALDVVAEEGDAQRLFLLNSSIMQRKIEGSAPIKAILEHTFHTRDPRSFVLYWGARVRADLYLDELPARWAREHNNFQYVPVLSEPRPGDHWSGRTGLVHEAVAHDIPDMSGCQVYACGVPVMVEAAHRDFTSRCGLPEEEFFSDAFTPATPEKLNGS